MPGNLSKFDESTSAPWRDSAAAEKAARETLPPLTKMDLRAAARTIRPRLGLGCDNTHPRWFGCLSDGLLQAFVDFLMALERLGMWPRQVSVILVAQVPKAGGGRRPIGLLSGLVKLWEKARKPAVAEWRIAAEKPQLSSQGPVTAGGSVEAGPCLGGGSGPGQAVCSHSLRPGEGL